MKSILFSASLFLALSCKAAETCSKTVVRREIRDLSPYERTTYFNAVKKLHEPQNDIFTQFCATHFGNVPEAHGVAGFFPWHRYFLREYEKQLQAIDPSIVLPYWDWSRDSQAPEKSIIFTDEYLGGNGRSSDNCITTGTFANWKAFIPEEHCLRRNFDGGNKISAFYSKESLEVIISHAKSFDALRVGLEGGPHGNVHDGVGGKNGDLTFMYSPNDPLFYLHHTFVDLLWSEWQSRNPSLAETYNGGTAQLTDIMNPFNITVKDALKISDFCYTYPRYSASLPGSKLTGLITAASEGSSSMKHFVQVLSRLASGFIKVDADDRSTAGKLRVPKPLSDNFINMNNLDMNQVRSQEATLANLTMILNAISGFKPEFSNI